MKPATQSIPTQPPTPRRRSLALGTVSFLLGAALTGARLHHHHSPAGSGQRAGELSGPTKNLLGHLESPVTIRYYSILPTDSAGKVLPAFAGRVGQLLAAIESAGGGKIQVTRVDAASDANAASATADGIHPFNLDTGDACFLGIVAAGRDHTESFAQLQPEWEAALEYDLARAILRAATPAAAARPSLTAAKPSPEIIAAVKTLIPDINATTEEEADRIFHEDFIKQCAAAGAELETQINAAQEKVIRAQDSGTSPELEAARKNLAQVQVAQADKLKQIAARLQTQLTVFRQMKAATTTK